jgi:hypothetical protein
MMRRFWLKHVLGRVKLGIRYVVSFFFAASLSKTLACKLHSDQFFLLAWTRPSYVD